MADWYPLIVDSVNDRLKELPLGDTLDLTGSTVKTDKMKIEAAVLSATSTTTTALDLSTSAFFTVTLNSSRTMTITNPDSTSGYAQSFMVEFSSNGTYSVQWPTNVYWDGGLAPSIGANKETLISIYTKDNGTTYRANVVLVSSTS